MPAAILIWVWFCAYLNCAGWTLSALHQLNAAGYAVALLLGGVALMAWWKQTSGRIFPQIFWGKLKHRFRRPFPLAFLIFAAMAFLGGALYAPAITTRWRIACPGFCTGWPQANGTGFTPFSHGSMIVLVASNGFPRHSLRC